MWTGPCCVCQPGRDQAGPELAPAPQSPLITVGQRQQAPLIHPSIQQVCGEHRLTAWLRAGRWGHSRARHRQGPHPMELAASWG